MTGSMADSEELCRSCLRRKMSSVGDPVGRSSKNVRISFASFSLSSVVGCDELTKPRGEHARLNLAWKKINSLIDEFDSFGWNFRLPFFEDANPTEALDALNHVYAGTLARTVSQVICHPIDTVKTRMQVKDPAKKLMKWKKKLVKKSIEIGPIDIQNWFFKGPSDLFRGVMGAILGTIPNAMLYFIAYESTKKKVEKHINPGLTHIASASVGTLAASVVRVPADTLKHRVQAYLHPNVFEAFQSVVKAEGIRGLYRGFWPTLMRDVPEIAIQFSVYESMRSFAQKVRKVEKLTTPEHLLLGAFAGAVAATCTMPLDLVKTRQQCGVSEGIHTIVLSVLREQGISGLSAGLGPRMFHVSMMSAVFFGFFEYCKLVIKPNRAPSDKPVIPKIWEKRRDHIWKRQFVYTE